MNHRTSTANQSFVLQHNLGMFEGFNFRTQSAVDHLLDAQSVVEWDHDRYGETEFWLTGDAPGVSLLFKHRSSVTAMELIGLDCMLTGLGGDSLHNFLLIHHAVNICGDALERLSAESVQDYCLHIFFGTSFLDLRREAAYELFELYYPEAYGVWNQTLCDGLVFDVDRFLDSLAFSVEEVDLGDQVALLVAPQ